MLHDAGRGSGVQAAQVALDAAAFGYDQLYTYAVPEAMRDRLKTGMRVAVPFGMGNRRRIAMVLALGNAPAEAEEGSSFALKPIAALLDREPVLTDELQMLVAWLHEHTFCTWYDAVRAVLPGGMQLRLEQH